MPAHKGGKRGSRKFDRNKVKCKQYTALDMRVTNKRLKLLKHLKTHSEDQCASSALARL
jgi:hypothetical protein